MGPVWSGRADLSPGYRRELGIGGACGSGWWSSEPIRGGRNRALGTKTPPWACETADRLTYPTNVMMDPALQAETLALLIDRLIEEGDPRAQERILVDEICAQNWAQSVALLRQNNGSESGWIEVLARGPEDLLPTPHQVAAIYDGQLTDELPLGRRALFAKDHTGTVALALGGCAEAQTEDTLSALLEVFCRFSASCGDSPWGDSDLLDMLQPPTPRQGADDDVSGDEPAE